MSSEYLSIYYLRKKERLHRRYCWQTETRLHVIIYQLKSINACSILGRVCDVYLCNIKGTYVMEKVSLLFEKEASI
jgi:hypothetical protein